MSLPEDEGAQVSNPGPSPSRRNEPFRDELCKVVARRVRAEPDLLDDARLVLGSERYRSAYATAWRRLLGDGQTSTLDRPALSEHHK